MLSRTAAALCLTACVASAADVRGGEQGALCVTLASWKEEYVLGEPVLLVLSAKNISANDVEGLTIYLDEGEPEIELSISQGGGAFLRYKAGFDICLEIKRHLNVLPPGQAWQYHLRVLYTRANANRLAFPQPGRYRVKAVYPLMGRRPSHPSRTKEFKESGREEYESNAVEIEIAEPMGIDATMWKSVQEPAFLQFLQPPCRGVTDPAVTPGIATGIPTLAATLLESVPHSSYHDAIRCTLSRMYDRRRERITYLESQKDRELARIRSALGIDEPPPGPFPEDARLDVIVTYEIPKDTPLLLVLEQLSWQSRVPLSADPKFAEQRCSSPKETKSLREFMDARDDWGRKWEPHGNGYRLVPAPIVLPPGFPGGPKPK